MMLKKIDHVGILVNEFKQAITKFKGLGFPCTEIKENQESGIRIAFFSIGDTLIELINFTGPAIEQYPVICEQKGAINHICFEVDDLEASIQDFKKNGAKLLKGYPRAGAHGQIAFFHPETTEGVLIEICQT
ncbi:MAG TPA: VOC family protein [Desulfatiglandales bacterium]|nr:VOC family protein [Desulfatiglandales bacterium]HUX80441.1 VOC family protein [Alphaproteobacteria bacterium]